MFYADICVAVDTDADHHKVSHLQALLPFAALVKRSFVYIQFSEIFATSRMKDAGWQIRKAQLITYSDSFV
jgi:hypothetical protein